MTTSKSRKSSKAAKDAKADGVDVGREPAMVVSDQVRAGGSSVREAEGRGRWGRGCVFSLSRGGLTLWLCFVRCRAPAIAVAVALDRAKPSAAIIFFCLIDRRQLAFLLCLLLLV